MPTSPPARINQRSLQPKCTSIRLDATHTPIVRVTLGREGNDGDFQAYLADSDRVLQDGRPYALVYDALGGYGLSPVQRRLQTEWIQRNHTTLHQLCVAGAFAITSSAVRGALTAILWVAPLPFEFRTFGTALEAEIWVREKLGQRGLTVRA